MDASTRLKTIAKRIVYRGNARECSCCGRTFSKFLPYGVVLRQDARCPECGSLERHRHIFLYLRRETAVFSEPTRLLHIAPEAAFRRHFAASANISYVTGDLFPERGDLKIDVTGIPFPDASFDVVMCNHVLEHVPEDRKAMGEMFRVLKTGGFAILQTPFDAERESTYEDFSITNPEEREKHFNQKDHVRIYGRDIDDRLRESGFELEKVKYAAKLSDEEIERFALLKDEEIYICRKA